MHPKGAPLHNGISVTGGAPSFISALYALYTLYARFGSGYSTPKVSTVTEPILWVSMGRSL